MAKTDARAPHGAGTVEQADEIDEAVMGALRNHVPITLIFDLATPDGPSSAEIAEIEGGNADWLPDQP